MKKILLLFVALSLCFLSLAQQRDYSKHSTGIVRALDYGLNNHEGNSLIGNDSYGGLENPARDILKTQISSSSNVFGIFTLDQVYLTTEPDLNMVVFGNRAGGPMGGTGNDLKVVYTTDMGSTWTDFLITPSVTGNNFRYPSVNFYNPLGNTDPANMYVIFSGPYTQTNWVGQYFGSVKFGGIIDKDITYEPNESNVYLNHMNLGLTVTPDGHIHVGSQRLNGTEANYTSAGWEILNGTFNNTTHKVDWQLPRITVNPQLGDDNRIDADELIFSEDGTIGYLIGNGIDLDENYNPYGIEWPVVYKSLDHGITWEKIEPFDFSEIEIFNEMLYPLRADLETVIPRWYNKYVGGNTYNGATVDINGNLHIAGIVLGTYSIDPDSLSQFYTAQPKLIFDVFMNGDGTWDAVFVDSIRTDPVATNETPFIMGWDQRIQMSRSEAGDKTFVVWADTDPAAWGMGITTNTQPDIYTWGRDVLTGQITPAENVTTLGDYWGDNYWLHVANKILEPSGEYQIPMITASPSTPTGTQDNPMLEFYSGVSIMVDVNDIDPLNNSISQNYPNPFSSVTRFDITLPQAARVSLDIFNLTGQRVISYPSKNFTAGKHSIDINKGNLKPSVYIYSITINGETNSHKMIVK